MTYRGHELEYLGRLTDPSAPDEYRCRLCGFAIAGNVFRTSTRAWSEVWVPRCDPLKRIRALERELAEARAIPCEAPCPECLTLAKLDAAIRASWRDDGCTKAMPKALASSGHDWLGGLGSRCAWCGVDRASAQILSTFRLSPDAFTPKENKPMQKPILQKRDLALEVLRRALADSTPEQQAGLAALIEVDTETVRRTAERARAELNLKPRHDVLGDMRTVLEKHGGYWRLAIVDRSILVLWKRDGDGHRGAAQAFVTRGLSECSLEQTVSAALDFIETFTRPDGGLDL